MSYFYAYPLTKIAAEELEYRKFLDSLFDRDYMCEKIAQHHGPRFICEKNSDCCYWYILRSDKLERGLSGHLRNGMRKLPSFKGWISRLFKEFPHAIAQRFRHLPHYFKTEEVCRFSVMLMPKNLGYVPWEHLGQILAEMALEIHHYSDKHINKINEEFERETKRRLSVAKQISSQIFDRAREYSGHPVRNFAENLLGEEDVFARSCHREALIQSYEIVDSNISEDFEDLKIALRYDLVFKVEAYQPEITEARHCTPLPMSPASLLTCRYLSFEEKNALSAALKLGY
jgi:hypothetical protein